MRDGWERRAGKGSINIDFHTPTPRSSALSGAVRNRQLKADHAQSQGSLGIYVLGAFLGMCGGVLNVLVGDLLLTALFVLASTLVLGALRPERPWRWIIEVPTFVPIAQWLAYLVLTEKPDRAQIYESFLAFLPAIAGAYGGALGRRGVDELFK
jgi:hypothetical protein